ncbi:cobalt ECF transporter T component CbiQ [Sporomusa sphaeroides]|uniref:Energy-coupling factor transporter transmembrane protein EcfT n=1 Tax=Sporomusa sphaeroides DSM 2875 TaxID=1337886 RepID=A0ABP2C9R5_9FIRM|nr:cobalt ECF transporter T component CbiQ [Sporomusa sphaeroides]OLS54470.1 energy-coupling factor transporter transmembrane protein EcfT [Sporomusa sphaeroides DSM 2875]CVK21059.1 Energy-coupling factor transporter transmembrane protein EcfT [Sporomusa sphaeroides DSM 2875]
MIKIEANWIDLRYLDTLAMKSTPVHRLNPIVKLIATLVFIITVTSFPKYEISGLLPFFLFPAVLVSLGGLPLLPLCKRLLLVAPFIIFIGIFNPLLDHTPVSKLGSFVLTGGWLSFASITIRLYLTVTAALILVATTGMNALGLALARIGIPRIIVVQILFMYRYLHVLLEEFVRSIQAYSLRSLHGDGIRFQAWGSLLGQLLLRSIDRANRIYQSMLCRGFDGEVRLMHSAALHAADILYLAFWIVFCLSARSFNIPQLLGKLLMGV